MILPLAMIFLMTSIYCLFSNMYLDWYWVEEWMYALPQTVADMLELAVVYLSLGVLSHFVYFAHAKLAAILTPVYAVILFVIPLAQYLIRHLFFASTMDRSSMEEWFQIDIFDAIYLVFYYALGLLVVWTLRAIWAWILLQKPVAKGKIFTVKHPVGLAMTIYFAANSSISTILFLSGGAFSAEHIWSILMEYGINLIGFVIAILGAWLAEKYLSDKPMASVA